MNLLAIQNAFLTNCSKPEAELLGNHLCLFSYGSGLQASMYSISITPKKTESLSKLINGIAGVPARLSSREKVDPSVFSKTMKLREENHHKGNLLVSACLHCITYIVTLGTLCLIAILHFSSLHSCWKC
jgi:3-hydroxy-3-methylglutaryl CoA synthase